MNLPPALPRNASAITTSSRTSQYYKGATRKCILSHSQTPVCVPHPLFLVVEHSIRNIHPSHWVRGQGECKCVRLEKVPQVMEIFPAQKQKVCPRLPAEAQRVYMTRPRPQNGKSGPGNRTHPQSWTFSLPEAFPSPKGCTSNICISSANLSSSVCQITRVSMMFIESGNGKTHTT